MASRGPGIAAIPTLWRLALSAGEGFAVVTDDGPVPGAEILRYATELAEAVAERGTGDQRALGAIATESPVSMVVGVLALSLLGGQAAMVGPLGAPGAMKALRDLSPAFVVYDGETGVGSSIASADYAVRLDGRTGAVRGHSDKGTSRGRASSIPPDDDTLVHRPFLAFRTSGTSIAPRWVVHSEASLWASLDSKIRGMARYEHNGFLSEESRATVWAVVGVPRAVFIPLATISGYTQFVHSLALGVPLVATAGFLPRRALRLTSLTGAGTLVVTPSMLRLMMTLPEVRTLNWDRLGVVGIGGGHVYPELLAAAEEAFDALVIQGYGSTELGGAVTNVRIYDDLEVRGHTVGRPLGGVEVEVRRADDSEATPAGTGELMVRAPDRLALGYLTTGAGAMIEPLELRGGFYPTGDIGTVRPDRNLVVFGRLGGRISRGDEDFFPEEVEAVLEAHPLVVRALVTTENRNGAVVVRATCEIRDALKIPAAEIRAWCSRRLSRARCPDVVDFATVPHTETGKPMRHRR